MIQGCFKQELAVARSLKNGDKIADSDLEIDNCNYHTSYLGLKIKSDLIKLLAISDISLHTSSSKSNLQLTMFWNVENWSSPLNGDTPVSLNMRKFINLFPWRIRGILIRKELKPFYR